MADSADFARPLYPDGRVGAMRRALRAHERAILTHEQAEALFERHGRHDKAAREHASAALERERRDEALLKLAELERGVEEPAPEPG